MKQVSGIITAIILSVATFTATAQLNRTKILILLHSDNGGTYELAKEVKKGIESGAGAQAIIKQVRQSDNPKLKDIPVATVEELPTYDGIAWGSPVYFGNISTGMSDFLAKTVDLWTNHALEGMPAMVFMSAGSGAGKELAMQSFLNSLAVHGMILVPNGIRGYENIDKTAPQGNTVLGTTSLASHKTIERPSDSERYLAELQGKNFVQVALALKGTFSKNEIAVIEKKQDVNLTLIEKKIILPDAPAPVGNYLPYVRSGNLVFINQVALKEGKILHAGKVGTDITDQQGEEATAQAMLNVLSVLKEAVGGDLNRVKRCVQLTGIFNTERNYVNHARLMNAASDLAVEVFGEKGKHARGTFGAYSLPVNSVVEIQAIFEVE
ncbi:Atu1372/SO_1960 family protein [Sphingobacterium sp. xlx-130]|uniref:Atu1372/SO_1960 family protein n=1 Tax=Sphingobacterium sp. xlx-130 TaxID=2654323 RepID=UPI0013DD2ED3|nr:Atu1372/SO_1960 family protein [Sphingobacterium sp. xlx-130]